MTPLTLRELKRLNRHTNELRACAEKLGVKGTFDTTGVFTFDPSFRTPDPREERVGGVELRVAG